MTRRLLEFRRRGESAAESEERRPAQLILVGSEPVKLPPGVSASQWALERNNWQNPRIRSILGCVELLDSVLESNYAILHCSPERLREIWVQVRKVTEQMRGQLAPLLTEPSCIAALERSRSDAQLGLELLDRGLLADLEKFPGEIPDGKLSAARKLLCVSIGKLQAFLQDTFGRLMEADPRGRHNADYFMSRRFPRDIEEAEWLHASVAHLQAYLQNIESTRRHRLGAAMEALRQEKMIPYGRVWRELEEFLDLVADDLASKLRSILALRWVRFDEMEILDHYVVEVPIICRQVSELGAAGRAATDQLKANAGVTREEREATVAAMLDCHAVFAKRIHRLLNNLHRSLRDLWMFVPFWLEAIERRRALLLKRH
ncbi:MAG: hypothetical protein ACE5EG_11520 [Thermoanaerobaculia bacterium]